MKHIVYSLRINASSVQDLYLILMQHATTWVIQVKKLQQQLQEETDLHLALESAVEHCGSPSSSSPGKLPDKAQELLDSIAVLEITVAKLEQEFVSLQCQISQERNERRLAEYHLKHLPFPSTSLFDSSLAYLTEPEAEQNTDDMHLPEAFIDNNYIVDNLWHHPNRLSEEMVLRMRDIFIFLADSSKLSSSSSSSSVSPASPHCPLANFLASSLDSPVVTSCVSSPSGGGAYDPYGVSDKVDWTFSIGTYCKAIEVSWLSVGKKELEYAAMALKRFRLLVEQLLRVDPSQMSSNEKLAFWVNLYNALIMHAYLAYGVPRNDIKLFSLMQKAAYTIGGLSVSAADIECTVLKMNPATYRPQILLAIVATFIQNLKHAPCNGISCKKRHERYQYLEASASPEGAAVFALQKFKASAELQKYTIDHPEPLLHFALSCGLHSSPAVRIFRPENMNELLKRSMQDYIQASVGISNKGKLLVPKLLHCFAKGMVEDSVLPDWICQFLSPQQASMVKNCLSRNKWRILGARVFSIIPFDSRFRFLFLLDDKSSQLSKSKV
ncbi:Methionyl-tRNA formyltransferase [Gossypium australe]|uniref:Methionyl-tRNA formyltransferase n=1 Tax=Gossypium australe TaxID=47621 RepID=A0A5B6UM85_9ROSI|nr:Methionyl-tRNA formyltransferase [Gossypium australe]